MCVRIWCNMDVVRHVHCAAAAAAVAGGGGDGDRVFWVVYEKIYAVWNGHRAALICLERPCALFRVWWTPEMQAARSMHRPGQRPSYTFLVFRYRYCARRADFASNDLFFTSFRFFVSSSFRRNVVVRLESHVCRNFSVIVPLSSSTTTFVHS